MRNLIAMLLVAAMPFCCCNFRSLLGGSLSCQNDSLPRDRLAGEGLRPALAHAAETHPCCHGRPSGEEGSTGPKSGNGPTDEPRDCSCDRTGGKVRSVEKPSIDPPAKVVVAILEWCTRPELRSLGFASGIALLHQAVRRPSTSLLRIHCALIV